MIELFHGGAAGHSASVLIALEEKGLDYQDRALDLAAFEQHGTEFLGINPEGQVPVLREDGRTLTEAFFILLYLDDCYPNPPLGGADSKARYQVQKWGKYVETHIAPNIAIVGWSESGAPLSGAAHQGLDRLTPERRALWSAANEGFSPDTVTTARAALDKAIARVAEDLGTGPWLAGADYSVADIIVFPQVARLARLGFSMPQVVADWLDRVRARAAVRKALGDEELIGRLATMGPERGRWG